MKAYVSIEVTTEDFSAHFGQIFLSALVEILGQQRANELIEKTGLSEFSNGLPDFDSDLQFSLDSLKRILLVMKQSYPNHSAQGILQRIGEASFSPALHAFGPALGLTQSDFQLLPLRRKLPEALEAIAGLLNEVTSSTVNFLQAEDHVQLNIGSCPIEGEMADNFGHFVTGLLRAALYWISGGKSFHLQATDTFTINEEGCQLHVPLKPAAY